MVKRGAHARGHRPTQRMRCAIATVNVPPIPRMELENWLWKEKKIRIRGGDPNKLRLSTPYYLSKQDIDRFPGCIRRVQEGEGIAPTPGGLTPPPTLITLVMRTVARHCQATYLNVRVSGETGSMFLTPV